MKPSLEYTDFTDDVLVELLKGGDRMAFDAIYHRYARSLYQYAFRLLEDEDECTDVVQDIFVWLWTHKKKLNISFLKGYLLAAVKYRMIRVITSSKRRDEILKSMAEQALTIVEEDPIEIQELKGIISDFVETLSPQGKRIFKMSREQYLSNKEIAAELNISVKTVENHMTSVLKKLRTHLGNKSFFLFL